MAIASLVILIFSVIMHEVAHGYTANALGDPTARLSGRLTLNPLRHIDPFGSIVIPTVLIMSGSPLLFGWAKPVPYNAYNLKNHRWGEALVAAAGPATNITLALIFGMIIRYGAAAGLSPDALSLAAVVTFINIFLGFFNLMPFPPLDGFTVLRGALPWHLTGGLSRFEMRLRSVSNLSLIFFLFLFWMVLSVPFYRVIEWTFMLITGAGPY